MTAQERNALPLFARTSTVAARDVAEFFGISMWAGSKLCIKWTEKGFLVIADPSKKARRYRLAEKYEGIIAAEARPKRKPRDWGQPKQQVAYRRSTRVDRLRVQRRSAHGPLRVCQDGEEKEAMSSPNKSRTYGCQTEPIFVQPCPTLPNRE